MKTVHTRVGKVFIGKISKKSTDKNSRVLLPTCPSIKLIGEQTKQKLLGKELILEGVR